MHNIGSVNRTYHDLLLTNFDLINQRPRTTSIPNTRPNSAESTKNPPLIPGNHKVKQVNSIFVNCELNMYLIG